jgi:hypothetical protein
MPLVTALRPDINVTNAKQQATRLPAPLSPGRAAVDRH